MSKIPSLPHPLSILLVEDSEVTQDLLSHFLSRRGHSVEVVSDGEEALEALYSRSFDVVLADYHIPKKDGLEVVVEYRSKKRDGTSPKFIGITADLEGLMAHPGNCENFDKVFSKPFVPSQLCEDIEKFWIDHSSTGPLPTDESVTNVHSTVRSSMGPASDNPCEFAPSSHMKESFNKTGLEETAAKGENTQHREHRLHKRLSDSLRSTTLTMPDGSNCPCEINDISAGGANIIAEIRPRIGDKVMVGKTEAKVVRHTDDGIAVEFNSQMRR